MPVYLVTAPGNPPTEKLVDAANTASARNHVARQVITAKVAKQADLFRVAKAGGDIETAGAEVPEPAAAPEGGNGGGDGNDTGKPPVDPPAGDNAGKGGKAK